MFQITNKLTFICRDKASEKTLQFIANISLLFRIFLLIYILLGFTKNIYCSGGVKTKGETLFI